MQNNQVSRRDLLAAGVFAGAGAVLAGCSTSGGTTGKASEGARVAASNRVLRFAHMTDSHVLPEREAPAGLALALQEAMKQQPELVITGGDLIMDGFAQSREATLAQWSLFREAFAKHCRVPARHTLGNHDVWGWDKPASSATGTESDWGKAMALQQLGMSSAYYSFSQGPWRIIVLDSVQPFGEAGYAGGIDDVQFAWLASELAAARQQHVCVVSHIPILHASTLLVDIPASAGMPSGATTGKDPVKGAAWGAGSSVRPGTLFTNRARVCRLFRESGNVRLCLSGHIHTVERIEFMGTTYVCGGAVSGAWWQAQSLDVLQDRVARCEPGFTMVNLHADGTHACEYVRTNWVMRA